MKDNRQLPVPPDGGYGWVVVFGSFVVIFVIYGVILSYGLLLEHLMEFYQITPGIAAIPNSLLTSATMMNGPISAACVTRFGTRFTTMTGATLAAFGLAVSVLMTKFSCFCFFYGVVGGLGVSLLYLPANVHVGMYFEKRRALATGIFTMGGGVGLMVVGPLTTFLLQEYGWRGTVLLFGGMYLQCAISGAIFRPLQCKDSGQLNLPEKSMECVLEEPCNLNPPSAIPVVRIAFVRSVSTDPSSKTDDSDFQSLLPNIKTMSASQSKIDDDTKKAQDVSLVKHISISTIQRQDAYYSGSIQQLPEYQNCGGNIELYRASTIRIPDEVMASRSRSPLQIIKSTLQTTFDFKLLGEPIMAILIVGSIFSHTALYVPYDFTTEVMLNNGGTTAQIRAMYIGSGISNIFGPPIFGWLVNNTRASALGISAITLLISGAMTMCVGFFEQYYWITIYFTLYGLIISGYFCLGTIIVVECFGLEKLTSGYGLVLLARGIGVSIGSPIAGAIYHATGSFIITFAYTGTMMILSCCTLLLIPCLKMIKTRRQALL